MGTDRCDSCRGSGGSRFSNAVDRSRRMRTDEMDEALAAWSDSVPVRNAVSVECAVLKPD